VAVLGHSDRPRSQSAPPLWGFLKKRGCQGRGVQRGGARRGKRRPKRAARVCVRGPVSSMLRCHRSSARRGFYRDRCAGVRELSSPLSRMQRPCRGVRCEHKLTAAFSPMAIASEATRHGSVARVPPLSRMQSCARAPGRGHARATVPSKTISAPGACTVERTGPCQRERGVGPRSCPHVARERVQGPGRGDRGTDRGAICSHHPDGAGRPCGRN
jgi:hypothetical protein